MGAAEVDSRQHRVDRGNGREGLEGLREGSRELARRNSLQVRQDEFGGGIPGVQMGLTLVSGQTCAGWPVR